MPTFKTTDAGIWVSKIRETAFNTPVTTGANFLKMASDQPLILLPKMRKTDDANSPGNGHEFATYICNEIWENLRPSFSHKVNFDLDGRLGLRSVGGTITDTLLATGVYKHSAPMVAASAGADTLPSSTLISLLGGASYLFAGAKIERYRLSQQGRNPVICQIDFVTSGKHRSPHAVTSLPATLSQVLCPKGTAKLQYTDSGGLKDLATGCRVRSWSVEVVMNYAPDDDRCIGDPEQVINDFTTANGASAAAYNSTLTRGDRVVSGQIEILLDSTLPEVAQMATNEELTNITFGAVGPVVAGGINAGLNFVIPRGTFRDVTAQDSNRKAAIVLQLNPLYDSVSGGAAIIEVINDLATME